MRVMITGGAGFIGSHILLELLQNSGVFNICVVDNFCTSTKLCMSRIKNSEKRMFQVFEIDLRENESMKRLFESFKPQLVIHCAGLKSVLESERNPEKYYDNNVGGAVNLIKNMELVDCNKIIFSSSATVYGPPKYLPYDEKHPTLPSNPYGQTKLIVESLIKSWAKVSGRSGVSLRYFNPIGAHMSGIIGETNFECSSNLVPTINDVLNGKKEKLLVYGTNFDTPDGTGIRDYLHVVDLARAHVNAIALLQSCNNFSAINLGRGKGISVLEIVGTFEKISGRKIPIEFKPVRKGDLASYWSNCDLATEILNWSCIYGIEDMCRDSWKWSRTI
ncbi:MAG: UDP-glucose 4-epimerase GalE [Pseudomonadota bacterium]|nr:UDP-glucose 4-epimerase GalE [Pseudomonadota bacterium]